MTPKGPARSGGQISEMNMGEITEKDPAADPIMSLPTIIVPKDFTSETPIPMRSTTLIMRRAFFLPIEASFPPERAPIAAPNGAAVPMIEFAVLKFF